MSFDPGFRGKYLLSMCVEDLSNLARSKSCALPVRPLDCVRAVPAAAENITKQEIKTRLRNRLRLCIFRVPFLVAILLVCWLLLRSCKIVSDKVLQSQDQPELFWGQTEARLRQKKTNSQNLLRIHLHNSAISVAERHRAGPKKCAEREARRTFCAHGSGKG